jgi:hypothetical protein
MAAMVEALLGAVFRDSGGRVDVAKVAWWGWDWGMLRLVVSFLEEKGKGFRSGYLGFNISEPYPRFRAITGTNMQGQTYELRCIHERTDDFA